MSLDSILGLASIPESEGFLPRHAETALCAAKMLQGRPRNYWDLGREKATLFSYALYNIFSRDARYQTEAEEVIKGLEKAYSTLKETMTRGRALAIILDEEERIGYHTRDFRRATVEQKQQLYLLQQARAGHIRRRAKQFYEAFKDGRFGKACPESEEPVKAIS